MSYDIAHFNGTVAPTSGPYPYGNVLNQPGGTLVDATCMADIFQFFQRMCANASVAPNNTPDNNTNGWQFQQALNKLINQESSGMATAFGASGLTPVIMSGLVFAMGGSTYTVSAGWFFYNGQYVYCAGTSIARTNPGGGQVVLFTIAPVDGLPVATISNASTVTDAAHFPQSIMVGWSHAVGFDTLNSEISTINGEITTLNSEIAALPAAAWTTPTLVGTWTGGTDAPRYTKNGIGQVSLEGGVIQSGGGTGQDIFNLPAGFRPSRDLNISLTAFNGTNYIPILLSIVASTGLVTIVTSSFSVASTAAFLYFDGINFLTL